MAKPDKSLRVLFDEASEIQDARARAAFLDEACAGDVALRGNLEEMFQLEETVGGFLADLNRDPVALPEPMVEQAGDRIGRYKLLQKIGEGGCGIVYMAEQLEPVRRRVALKVIKLGMDTASMIARFEAERQALALMDHPNIAKFFDAGVTGSPDSQLSTSNSALSTTSSQLLLGRPFFVMELVRGTKITEFCEQNKVTLRERLQLFIQVCHAVQHAHQKGIIHRDLKPSNVLVTSNDGVLLPKIIDFGIAKATADVQLTDKTLFTRFEMFLGTPAYMSPEQAEPNAEDVDTRTDIYSLGVLLYELLTGRPPFESEAWDNSNVDALRKAIREKEPTRPSTRLAMELKSRSRGKGVDPPPSGPDRARADGAAVERRAPASRRDHYLEDTIAQLRGDLDWIVLKALEKDRKRRYDTANAFAEDLQRHLRHEPVLARPPSSVYLLQKAIRRNRSAFAIVATTALLLVAGVIVATHDAIKTRRAEKRERELRQKAQASGQQAELARNEADAANRILSRNLFVREWLDAEALLDEGKNSSALAWFARAARDHPDDAALQTRLLTLLTERSFVIPADRPLAHDSPVQNFAFLSDGRHLATAAGDGAVRVWRLNAHSDPLILSNRFENPAVAAAPGPNLLLVDDARSVSLWNLNGLVKQEPISHLVNLRLPISADGRFAAIYAPGGAYGVWDIGTLEPKGARFEGTRNSPPVTGFSPDGKYMLGTKDGGQISAWEIASGRLAWQTPQTPGFRGQGAVEAEVEPNGKSVIVSCWLGSEGGELSGWTFEPSTSPDSAPAIASSAGWVVPTRSPIGAWCFSPNGRELYVGDAEGRLGLVNLTTHELHTLNGQHDGRVTFMGLSRDGQQLATASVDGTVRLWDARMKSPEPLLITNATGIRVVKLSPDSKWFACNGEGGVELRDARSGALLKALPTTQPVTFLDTSRDGRRILACGDAGRIMVWDSETGVPIFQPVEYDNGVYAQFTWDARRILIFSDNATLRVCETATGRQVGPTLTNTSPAVAANFSADDHSLVVMTDMATIEIWSWPEGRLVEKTGRHHKDIVWAARPSPDGEFLVTASRDRTAAVWEAGTGKLVREFRHEQQVYSASFSPDGARIVTGDASHKAHVWDVKSGRRLLSLPVHAGNVWFCQFSSDGQMLLTGDDAGTARLWDANRGLPLCGWVRHGLGLKRAGLSADGRMVLTATGNGTLRLWSVVRAPMPAPNWLPELAEALAGTRLRDDGAPEPVSAKQWETLEASLSSSEGDDFCARWARWFFVERLKERPALFVP
jgi:serine/threonine protein kinase/WD40 repeat protein